MRYTREEYYFASVIVIFAILRVAIESFSPTCHPLACWVTVHTRVTIFRPAGLSAPMPFPVISALKSFARGGGKRKESPCWWYIVYLYDTRNDLPRNSYYCVLDDFRLFIFYLLCKIYNTNSILEMCSSRACVFLYLSICFITFIQIQS